MFPGGGGGGGGENEAAKVDEEDGEIEELVEDGGNVCHKFICQKREP